MKLPLFPLNLVSFPEETVHLHIFEPRYRQLIHECDERDLPFGIITQINDSIAIFGTEMVLNKIEKIHSNGQMDVVASGRRVFKLKTFYHHFPGRLFSGGDVEFKSNQESVVNDKNKEIKKNFIKISKVMGIKKDLPNMDTPNFSFKIAHQIGFSLKQKIHLLSIDTEESRQKVILEYFDEIISLLNKVIP